MKEEKVLHKNLLTIDEDNRFLTIKEVSELLRCSIRTVHRRLRSKRNPLACLKNGKILLFERDEVERWLENARVRSNKVYQMKE